MSCETALDNIDHNVLSILQNLTNTADTDTERLLMEAVANLKDLNINIKLCHTELTKLNTIIGGS